MSVLLLMLVVLVAFGLCFAAMAVGVLIRGRAMRGGCSSDPVIDDDGRLASCGVCPKKEISLCETDDETGLAGVASLSTLGRFDSTHDKH
ncbi:MAG: hypothetical protein O2923_00345 [Verrucomicrobia bacterium]|nr:hypothetical protein [Verrucomicrobiota bacterium]MDA1085585.1 hypothetical protein [Verrucomicrobiota bacterium]